MLSIITPVYNADKYLAHCLDSVLNQQEFTDFEYICVNDGSTDESQKILESYRNDTRLKILKQDNMGAGVARNKALDIAKGDYVMFLDADDIMTRGHNIRIAYESAQNRNVDVLLAGFNGMSCDEHILYTVSPDVSILQNIAEQDNLDVCNKVFHPKEIGLGLFCIVYSGPCAKLFRRVYIEERNLRFLTLRRSEDFAFVELSIACSERLGILDVPLFNRRYNVCASLEANKDQTPLIFHDAEIIYYSQLKERGLIDYIEASKVQSLFRLLYNLKSVRTYEGFRSIFDNLTKFYEECRVDVPQSDPIFMRYKNAVDELYSIMKYTEAGEYFFYKYHAARADLELQKKTMERMVHENGKCNYFDKIKHHVKCFLASIKIIVILLFVCELLELTIGMTC